MTVVYKNLLSGYAWTVAVTLPGGVTASSKARSAQSYRHLEQKLCCCVYAFAALFLGGVAAVLGTIALPEVVAGAAYAAMMGNAINGLAYASVAAGFIDFFKIGCS
ncbi:MAG TPA: hypothetical protein VFB22_14175 [Candidatus Baltobacteraceae bacterium]|nr:hypothetical protein [Candidatus Baltobacteraceae bacterium]